MGVMPARSPPGCAPAESCSFTCDHAINGRTAPLGEPQGVCQARSRGPPPSTCTSNDSGGSSTLRSRKGGFPCRRCRSRRRRWPSRRRCRWRVASPVPSSSSARPASPPRGSRGVFPRNRWSVPSSCCARRRRRHSSSPSIFPRRSSLFPWCTTGPGGQVRGRRTTVGSGRAPPERAGIRSPGAKPRSQ